MLLCSSTFAIFGITILNGPHVLNGQTEAQTNVDLTKTTLHRHLARLYAIVPECEHSMAKEVFDMMKAQAQVHAMKAQYDAYYKIALKEVRKRLYRGFACFIDTTRIFSETVYEMYGLTDLKISKDMEEPWPIAFKQIMVHLDYYIHNDTDLAKYDSRGLQNWYLRWYHCVNATGKVHDTALSKLLHGELMKYYLEKKTECSELSYLRDHYTNGTTFCRYAAAVITRMYKLGCLFQPGLLRKFYRSYMEKKHLSFSTVLFEFMPQYFITEDHIDIINIVWKTSGFNVSPMSVGKSFKRYISLQPTSTATTEVTVAIPYSSNCYEEDGPFLLMPELTPPTDTN